MDGSFQSDFDTALGDQISFSTYYKKLYNEGTSLADRLFMPIRHGIRDRYVSYKDSHLYNGQLVARMEDLGEGEDVLIRSAQIINQKESSLPDAEIYFYYINNDSEIDFETGERRGTYELLRKNLNLADSNCAQYTVDSFEEYKENFYYSDHHWNHKGSYRAYLQLLELMGVEDEALVPEEEVLIPGIFYGSKGLTIGSTTYLDRISAYRFSFPAMEISVNGELLPDYGDMEGLLSRNQPVVSYAAVYGDDMGCMKLSTHRPDRDNILIVGDSYDNALIKLLSSHFNDTHSVDMRYFPYVMGELLNLEEYVEENSISTILFIGAFEFFHNLPELSGW